MHNRQFGRRVHKVVAPYIGVCPDFMEGGIEARPLSCFPEVGYVVQQELVVVIVLCTRGTGVGMVVPNGLKAGQGICEHA